MRDRLSRPARRRAVTSCDSAGVGKQAGDRRAVLGGLRADCCHCRVVAEPSILTRQVNGIRPAGADARARPGLQAISRAGSAFGKSISSCLYALLVLVLQHQ